MYTRRKIALLAIGLCIFIGCKENGKFVRKANPDFKGVVQRFENYGFSMKLYSEYKKVADEDTAFCFIPEKDLDKNLPENLAVVFWGRDKKSYKDYSNIFSKPQDSQNAETVLNLEELGLKGKVIKAYKMDNPDFDLACVIWTKEQKLFNRYNRLRLELFPKNKKQQITVVMKATDEHMNKLFDMAESIGTFPIEAKSVEKHVHDNTCQH